MLHRYIDGVVLYVTETTVGLRDEAGGEWELARAEGDGSDDLVPGDSFVLWIKKDDDPPQSN